MYSSEEVVETFLKFFESRDHLRIPGASLVPKDDPTLLFINSGMAPMKPFFLGLQKPPHPDLCNIQACIRTVDIDIVGDRHHLTLFEMLGSWSIGRYWKRRAIELAYDLLVNGFHFDPATLYASVYSGDAELGIPADEESAAAWEAVGLPRDHIVALGADNFWGPAGKYGPCGPCTEVFFDTGPEHGPAYVPGGVFDTESRYIEIWNAGVFMEFDKQPTGLERLALRSVDTGSGLERMVMNLNRLESVYDVDRLKPLFETILQQIGGGSDPRIARDARVIADHLRAVSFIVADGVAPSNVGRGYIPRRLIRKCIALTTRRGVPDFNIEEPLDTLIKQMGADHPRLVEGRSRIVETFNAERRAFSLRLTDGLERLGALASQRGFRVSGADALSLFATYGLPIEIIRDFVAEHGGELDEAGFQHAFARHQDVSRGAAEAAADYASLDGLAAPTEYLGEQDLTVQGTIQAALVDGQPRDVVSAGDDVEIVVDRTSFYAESGGQIGDRGEIVAGDARVEVRDTVRRRDLYVSHIGTVAAGSFRTGDTVELRVNPDHRRRIRASHSATHLLQRALRTTLGAHVQQAGSRVEPGRLRFDFQHGDRLSADERHAVEQLVNDFICQNVATVIEETTYADAVQRGALAFFGETYGQRVRMVGFPGISTELCGGSHVRATGDIGMFRIVSEGSVGSGVRRIVAATGLDALAYSQHQEAILEAVASRLNVAPEAVEAQLVRVLQRATKAGAAPAARGVQPDALRSQVRMTADGTPFVFAEVDAEPEALRTAALQASASLNAVVGLIANRGDKSSLVITVPEALADRVNASDILKAVLPVMDGHGGGKRHLAQGGGRALSDPSAAAAAFERAMQHVGAR